MGVPRTLSAHEINVDGCCYISGWPLEPGSKRSGEEHGHLVLNWGSSCPLNSPKGLGALDPHAQAKGSLGRTLPQRVCGAAHIWAGAVWPYPKPLGPGFPGGIRTLRNPGNPEGRGAKPD